MVKSEYIVMLNMSALMLLFTSIAPLTKQPQHVWIIDIFVFL